MGQILKFSIITVIILFFFSSQSFAQSQIEKGFGMRYRYEGKRIYTSKIKKLILSSGDSIAIN